MGGMIRALGGAACIDACQEMCEPLALAASAFMISGPEGATQQVCAHEEAFSCAVSPAHLDKCQALLVQASQLGFELPSNETSLHTECHGSGALNALQTADQRPGDADPCMTGLVGVIRSLGGAACIDACQEMCEPLALAASAFMISGPEGATQQV